MDIEAFRQSPVGKLVPISFEDPERGPSSYFAFVPSPLPKKVETSPETVRLLLEAAQSLGRLSTTIGLIPNPGLLTRPALRREAVSTSALEGTFAELEEVFEGEISEPTAVTRPTQEVINYVRAADQAVELLRQRPISINLLCELQAILVRDTDGDSYDSAMLRQRLVKIGQKHEPIEQARYVPPPWGDVLSEGMFAWEKWIHDQSIPLLIRIALGHYQFESLHPFADGNGRLGRLLISLQLLAEDTLPHPLLNISEWLEPRRAEYQDRLLQVSVDGNYDSWIQFISEGICAQSNKWIAQIKELTALQESIRERIRQAGGRSGTASRIGEELIGYPVIDVPTAVKAHGVSYPAARDALQRLTDLKILTEVQRTGQRTRRVFICKEVLQKLNL